MKRFLLRAFLFSSLLFMAIFLGGQLPNDTVVNESLLGAYPDKQRRVSELRSPKILFLGGSNVSLGMDTRQVAEHFHCDAYDLSLHAGLGLSFMLESSRDFAKPGDIFVVMPEYAQFEDAFFGGRELIAIVSDVDPLSRRYLSLDQTLSILPEWISYNADKIWSSVSLVNRPRAASAYRRDSFNAFGDAVAHWGADPEPISELPITRSFAGMHSHVTVALREYRDAIQSAGAKFVLLPPVLKATSFDRQRPTIEGIESTLEDREIAFAVPCNRYRFEDSLFFNTPYHLTKEGAEKRTRLVIEDLEQLGVAGNPVGEPLP